MADLIQKYAVPGPRYTSYPSVLDWEGATPEAPWLDSIRRDLGEHGRAALYAHVPFCERRCTYCGCNTHITPKHEVEGPFLDTLLGEWNLLKGKIGVDQIPLGELHLGGGTPTYLSPKNLGHLVEILMAGATPDCLASIEIDPRVTTPFHLEVLARSGFRRVSMGIQDFDPDVQARAHRIQTVDQVKTLVGEARRLGFEGVNFDLIYGLPGQTPKSLARSLKLALDLCPDRLAFYGYAHVPWIKAAQKGYRDEEVPSSNQRLVLFRLGREIFEARGYREIGMDHFAMPNDSLSRSLDGGRLHRNFMGYTEAETRPLLAIGPSAISETSDGFRQNHRDLETWGRAVQRGELPVFRGHHQSDEDIILREHILRVMTRFGTDWQDPARQTPFLREIHGRLAPMAEDGLVQIGPQSLQVTPLGRPFIRNVAMAFDARLARRLTALPRHSATV